METSNLQSITLNNCFGKVSGFNKNICILITDKNSYLVKRSDYKDNRTFSGIPLYRSENRALFSLLESGYKLSDIVSGVVDWECRKEWLKCFTDEQINEALHIENIFKDGENLILCGDCIRGERTNICYACNNAGLWQLYNDRGANRDIMHAILDYLFDNGNFCKGSDIVNFINARKWLG